jgi:hypothetical protein
MLNRAKVVAAAAAAYLVFQPLGSTSVLIGEAWIPEYLNIGFTAAEDPPSLLIGSLISLAPVLVALALLRRWGAGRQGLVLTALSIGNIMLGIVLLFGFWTCFPC